MAITRIISRSILRESSQSSSPRWLCTVAEKWTQPKSRNTLFYGVVRAGPKSSVVEILNKWVSEGKPVKNSDIVNLSIYFRSRKKYQASLQLYEWMDSSNLKLKNYDQAIRIKLIGKVEGVAAAEKCFDSIQEKTNYAWGALHSCYCKARILDKALETFKKLKELNCTSILHYNNMLALYHNLEQPKKVISLVQDMEEKNITPDIYAYNMLINSHAALENLDACEGVDAIPVGMVIINRNQIRTRKT